MALFSYHFHNLLGATYRGGSIVFTGDGNAILSPVGNRVNAVDLVQNRTLTLRPENRRNISVLAVTSDSRLLLSIDVDGHAQLLNFLKGTVLTRINFKEKVRACKWSPNNQWLCAGVGRKLHIYQAPSIEMGWKFAHHRTLGGHMEDINTVDWSPCSQFILTGADDLQARLWSIDPYKGFTPQVFTDHRAPLRGAFFSSDLHHVYTVARDGVVGTWVFTPEEEGATGLCCEGTWQCTKKAFCQQGRHQEVTRTAFHAASDILMVGFDRGIFCLYEVAPELSTLHTLSVGKHALDAVALAPSGEWLAVGCSETGQLLVWEWQSETYILKQQGHHFGANCVAFSPHGVRAGAKALAASEGSAQIAGTVLATGGYDGKVKLWNITSGFCFVTFAEHTAPVADLCFTPQANAVLSCSHDGSVRAFDLLRYRNFRTLVSPHGVEGFVSVAVDDGGEIVAAATRGDKYHIVLWSLQTGKPLDTIAGHDSSVSCVAFSPHPSTPGQVVTGSWDGTLQVWDVFARKDRAEALPCGSSVIKVAFDPRANHVLAAAQLSGIISFWNIETAQIVGSIEGIRDIRSGRGNRDVTKANNTRGKAKNDKTNVGVNTNQHFSSIAYSVSGQLLLCCSRNSPHICLYDTTTYTLAFRYTLTENQSLSGIKVMLNSKSIVGGVNVAEIDHSDSEMEMHERKRRRVAGANALPGVHMGQAKDAYSSEELHCWGVGFSMDGKELACSTSHGVFVYKVQTQSTQGGGADLRNGALERFVPQMLTENVTTTAVLSALDKGRLSKAMILGLALNDFPVLLKVYESIPLADVPTVLTHVGPALLPALLNFLAQCLHPTRGTPHVQFHFHWVEHLLDLHLPALMNWQQERTIDVSYAKGDVVALLLLLLRNVAQQHQNLQGVFRKNLYLMDFLTQQGAARPNKATAAAGDAESP